MGSRLLQRIAGPSAGDFLRPQAANVSRSTLRCRYSSEDLPASTRSIVVLPDSDATNLAVSDRLCLFVGGTVHAPSPYCRCVEFRISNNRLLSNHSSRFHPCRQADRCEERNAA